MVFIDEKSFRHCVNDYDNHDSDCESREHIWIGRAGGFSQWSEMFVCGGCGVTFWYDGARYLASDKVYENPYCDCCVAGAANI